MAELTTTCQATFGSAVPSKETLTTYRRMLLGQPIYSQPLDRAGKVVSVNLDGGQVVLKAIYRE